MLIERPAPLRRIEEAFVVHPVVALTGPRQCGKTTLARVIVQDSTFSTYFDLEAEVDRRRLETPEYSLGSLTGLVVIDEVQRRPELFETLRVLVDRPNHAARFLVLGSASPVLVKGVSESLAGRVGLVGLSGFDIGEVAAASWRRLWLRGGFPRSYLAPDLSASALWRTNFVSTFLERDIPQLGITIPAETLRRFWTMIAHYHGQVWNSAELARALGANQRTARRYLDILAGAFMVRVLPPWVPNLRKRQVKSPKVYLRDTGLLHTLLGLTSEQDVAGHPKVGASFEGFAIEQLLAVLATGNVYFWATHAGAELDLLFTRSGKNFGVEVKLADAPRTTKSMRVAIADLQLQHLWIVYPGNETYSLDDRITVLPVSRVPEFATGLPGVSGGFG
ncbi:MAG: ATP-binding protein [Acidobacteriota bacterium]|nr:ATP-binding protein [Acidobacteriota bacterium]